MSWTDDELRVAIHEAAQGEELQPGVEIILDSNETPEKLLEHELRSLRRILTALGIDHQPKPVLPTEVGSVIYDAVDTGGNSYSVLTLDNFREWCGVDQDGEVMTDLIESDITSFGGVLDLDKVRGDGDE